MSLVAKATQLLAVVFTLSCAQPTPATVVEQPAPVLLQTIECGSNGINASRDHASTASSWRMGRVASQTRNAAVKILHVDGSRRGSGVYMRYEGHTIVLTAAHVIDGGPPYVFVENESGEQTVGAVINFELSSSQDFAVIVLQSELQHSTAMPLKLRDNYREAVGEQVVYSGSPGHHDLLTIYGNVAGIAPNQNLILHSYAWMGASGSGVFDHRGNLIGILRAIDVNSGVIAPQLTEDIVWIAPINNSDLERLAIILRIYELSEEIEKIE